MQLFGKMDKRKLSGAPPTIESNKKVTKTSALAMKLYNKRDKTKQNT
jgi:hypothetical protein